MKPTSNDEAMKKAQSKVKTTVQVAGDAVALENEDRVKRGEEKMSSFEQRKRQAEIYENMMGINREDRD